MNESRVITKAMKSMKTINESIKWHKAIEGMKTYINKGFRMKGKFESKIQYLNVNKSIEEKA